MIIHLHRDPVYKDTRGVAVRMNDVLISATVEKNCKSWSSKLVGKDSQKVCLGLKLKTLKIERIGDLDIEMIGPWFHKLLVPIPVTSGAANKFVRKSVNHLIHSSVFETLKTMLDESLVDIKTAYRGVMGKIVCKHDRGD